MSSHSRAERVISFAVALLLGQSPAVFAKGGGGAWEQHTGSAKSALSFGDFAKAESDLNLALEDSRKFKDDDVRLGDTYFLMGQLNASLQNYTLAKQYYERALNVQQKLLGAQSEQAANSLYGIAMCCQYLGDHLGAEIFLKRVEEIWRKKYGANDPRLISILPSMGTYASMKNNLAQAEQYYKQLVDIEAAQGGSNPRYGDHLNLLATTLGAEGKFGEAKGYATKAVDYLKKNSDSAIAIDSAEDNLRIVERKATGVIIGDSGEKSENAQLALGAPNLVPAVPINRTPSNPIPTEKGGLKTPVNPDTGSSNKTPVNAGGTERPKTPANPEGQEKPKSPVNPPSQEKPKTPVNPPHAASGQAKPEIASASGVQFTAKINENKARSGASSESKPWHTNKLVKKNDAKESSQHGKTRYLADGRLITAEEYKALLLATEAYEMMRQEKYKMAADILTKALDIFPELPSAHTNIGLALTRLGRSDEAIEHLKVSIALDPTRSAPWVNLASSFQTTGRLKDCVETYKEYLQRFPNDSLASKARELVNHLQEEVDEQESVEKTLAVVHENPKADYFAYTTSGGTVKWDASHSPIKVYIGSGHKVPGFKTEYQGIMTDAFNNWATASQDKVKFDFVTKPEGSDIECVWTNDYSKVASPAEGGEAQVQSGPKGIEHVKIVILTADPTPDSPLSQNQIRAVCLHEIGHSLGLMGHSPDPSDIMFCTMPSADAKIAISTRDTGTVRRLYSPDVQIAFRKAEPKRRSSEVAESGNVETHAYSQTIEKLEADIKTDPDNLAAKEKLSKAYNDYALELAGKGKNPDAELVMKKAVSLQSAIKNISIKINTLTNYASILRKLQRDKEADKYDAEAKKLGQ